MLVAVDVGQWVPVVSNILFSLYILKFSNVKQKRKREIWFRPFMNVFSTAGSGGESEPLR